jgi:nucleotide-binding universal stress UspA family protein
MATPSPAPRRSGPMVIGYDGSPAADHAVVQAAAVLRAESAVVVAVWEAGGAYESAEWAAITLDTPAPVVDLRTAAELDQAAYAATERAAQHGAATVRSLGLPADPLVVADDLSVADTLVRVAREQDAAVLVIGARHHSAVGEVLLGSTERDVVRSAPCPVLLVREEDDGPHH